METNYLGAYLEGAFRAAITSCFINGRISEQQIDVAKEIISRFKEYEIEHAAIMPERREEQKRIILPVLKPMNGHIPIGICSQINSSMTDLSVKRCYLPI